MGLFDKKYCDVCGDKIGLLGNKKLEDGNLCKSCAGKLSPFFNERRHSTVADIKEQLAYRSENQERLASFNATRTIGSHTKLMMDEDARNFVISSARNIQEANPDLISFADVTGVNLDVNERRWEEKTTDSEGNSVSYSPPRWNCEYDYTVHIHVKNPYFDEVALKLNNLSINERDFSARNNCEQEAAEIKEILLAARQEIRDEAAAAAAPKANVVCAFCGATTTPDAAGNCEYCGAPARG